MEKAPYRIGDSVKDRLTHKPGFVLERFLASAVISGERKNVQHYVVNFGEIGRGEIGEYDTAENLLPGNKPNLISGRMHIIG